MASASSAASLRLLRRPIGIIPLRPARRLLCVASPSALTTNGDSSPASVAQSAVVDVNPPRGTRDFVPEEMRLRSWLFDNFREVSRSMAFEEVDFPVLESEALFIRKAGEEITQQLYNFEDKGGRRVVLRPEITPSLARLVIKQGKSVSLPLKWFTIGQCWRYERMTRGRRREHYQWNMDIFGMPKVRAEAELIQAIVLLFERLGITSSDVGIRLSSRKVLQAVLNMYSVPQHLFTQVCVIVDKLGKLSREEIEKELISTGLSSEAVQGIIEVLSLKSLSKLEEVLGSGVEAVADLKKLFSFAEQYGYADWICFDASVVRAAPPPLSPGRCRRASTSHPVHQLPPAVRPASPLHRRPPSLPPSSIAARSCCPSRPRVAGSGQPRRRPLPRAPLDLDLDRQGCVVVGCNSPHGRPRSPSSSSVLSSAGGGPSQRVCIGLAPSPHRVAAEAWEPAAARCMDFMLPPPLFSVCIRVRHREMTGSNPSSLKQRPAAEEGRAPRQQLDGWLSCGLAAPDAWSEYFGCASAVRLQCR